MIRDHFPILSIKVNGKPLIYLDSAASAQKPKEVLDAQELFATTQYANVHRGIHYLAETATEKYEQAREIVATFIGAEVEETIFTSGTTAGLNMVAQMLGNALSAGDEIVVSIMEHHSNFVPWQQLAKKHNAHLKIIPITPEYRIDMHAFKNMLSEKTKIVAITHVSNTLGTINPIKEITALAHAHGAVVIVDGAQALPHISVDVKELDVDFYTASAHKMYGPTGIGVLYGKKSLLETLSPTTYGGEMVKEVTVKETSWNDLPWKFEAGTPNIIGAIGFGAAVQFMQKNSAAKEHEILVYALEQLSKIKELTIIGPQTAEHRGGAISFTVEGVHPHDVSAVLDQEGIAVRAGHHCTQPLHCALGIDATTRASIGIYTTKEDIDHLIKGLEKVKKVFP